MLKLNPQNPAEKDAKMIMRQIGTKMQKLRYSKKLTRKEAAERAGIGVNTLARFENGVSDGIHIEAFLRVANAVGYDWTELFQFTEQERRLWTQKS